MKSSPLFGNGYYYPPQMAAHLPFMPHPAMMNMAALNGHLHHNSGRPNGGRADTPKDLSCSPMKDTSALSAFDRNKFADDVIRERNEKNNNTTPCGASPPPLPRGTPRLLGGGGGDRPLNLNVREHERRMSVDRSGAYHVIRSKSHCLQLFY